MDSKFQEISRFLDGLEKSNLINDEEQALCKLPKLAY